MIFNKDEKHRDLKQIFINKMIEDSLISFDADEVMLALNKGSSDFIMKHYNEVITTQEQVEWSYIVDKYPRIIDFWSTWELYSTIPVIDGIKELIAKCKQEFGEKSIQIVTSSPESIISKKIPWLQELFEIEKVFNVNSEIGPKSMYTGGTILVDDGLHNIDDHIENTGMPAIIYNHNDTYGWNKEERNSPLIHRATNHQEIFEILKKELNV